MNYFYILMPCWPLSLPPPANASDCATTREKFGTVAIHSPQLAEAINNIELNKDISEYQQLPLLPVVGKEECQLFERLVVTDPQGPIIFEQMAIEWCKEVDAVNIFPKLTVYLRNHYSKWQRNQRQRVRDAVAKAAPGETRLRELNAALGFKPAATTKAAMHQ